MHRGGGVPGGGTTGGAGSAAAGSRGLELEPRPPSMPGAPSFTWGAVFAGHHAAAAAAAAAAMMQQQQQQHQQHQQQQQQPPPLAPADYAPSAHHPSAPNAHPGAAMPMDLHVSPATFSYYR